jgi:transcriptional regulator of met regulon
VSQALERIRRVARERKKERLTALFHHINTDLLEEAFLQLKEDAAPGVDRMTWKDYEADLERNRQQSLTARLDRLGPAREVAQIASVIGRGFSYPLLRAVASMEDATLQTALERLAEADILLVQGLPPESDNVNARERRRASASAASRFARA